MKLRTIAIPCASLALVLANLTGCGTATKAGPRTVTVAQSGAADVTGSDNVALQKAADMLRPGDTLSIGPGTYTLENSLFIPTGVTVRGTKGQTILRKGKGVQSALAEDGDYGESQLLVAEPEKFRPGMGITVLDDQENSGWDVSVTAIKAIEGNLLRIDPMTLRDYSLEPHHARIQNTFPILAVIEGENVVLEDIIVDGNKDESARLDGCRGGAIYLYRSKNSAVRNCVARNYNGDGISFQVTDGIQVIDCEAYGNTGFGAHPGTGSPRATVKGCRLHHNGDVGLFLCWRVRKGEFSGNIIEDNGHYGISIGHKDTDNVFTNNTVRRNGVCGVYFRNETLKNAGHRNTFRNNLIADNGTVKQGYGFLIEPKAGDIVIENNRISDSRTEGRGQRYAVYKVAGAGDVKLASNTIEGSFTAEFKEGSASR
jgi:parallel beta-helix repeat protein